MKIFLIIILSVFFWNSRGQGYYEKAFVESIATSESFKSRKCYSDGDFMIQKKLIPFGDLAFMFSEKLKDVDKIESSTKGYLKTSLGKRRSRHKVFFSEVRNGYFFAEVFCDGKKRPTRYEKISSFGMSYVYLFKIGENGFINLLEVADIHSN